MSSNQQPHSNPRPWRATDFVTDDDDIGFGGDDGDVGFITALRRYRHRHGLTPTTQAPTLSDDDLKDLRQHDADRPDPFAEH